MDMILTKRLNLLAAACLLTLTACNSDDDTQTRTAPARTVSVVPYTAATTTPLTTFSKKISYRMPSVNGGETIATAVVFVPKGTPPAGGWPIIAWAHGTTGVADICAPSGSDNLGLVDPATAVLVQQGYMVVAPDYEGLGSDGIHPYLHLASEGRSLVYAVLAARENVSTAGSRWMAYGHSQGGHAALGAAQYAHEATGLSYLGTVAVAPVSNLSGFAQLAATQTAELLKNKDAALLEAAQQVQQAQQAAQQALQASQQAAALQATDPLKQNPAVQAAVNAALAAAQAAQSVAQTSQAKAQAAQATAEQLLTAVAEIQISQISGTAHIVAGLRQTTKINYSDVFGAQAAAIAPLIESRCGIADLLQADMLKHVQATGGNLVSYTGLKANFASVPEVITFLSSQTEPATVKLNQPVMLVQGGKDVAVPTVLTEKLKNDMIKLGSTVNYQFLPNADHISVFVDSAPQVLGFMAAQFNPTPSSTAQ